MLKSIDRIPREFRWGLLFPILFLNGWLLFLLVDYVQPLMSMVLIAGLMAFIMEFPLVYLEHKGISRGWSLGMVFLLAIAIIVIVTLTLIPMLAHQLQALATALPAWLDSLESFLNQLDGWAVSQQLNINWSQLSSQLTNQLTDELQAVSSQIGPLLTGSFDSVLTTFFTLVFAVFLLLGGEQVYEGILSWLSPWWRNEFRTTFRDTFKAFIVGRLLLGVIYSVALVIIFGFMKVPLALLSGIILGMSSILPFFGTVSTVIIGGIYLVQNFWLGVKVIVVAFVLGQLNDVVLYPKLVGKAVDLNPVWLLIAVLIGFKLAGILGLLFATPIASFIKKMFNKKQVRQTNKRMVLATEGAYPNSEIDR